MEKEKIVKENGVYYLATKFDNGFVQKYKIEEADTDHPFYRYSGRRKYFLPRKYVQMIRACNHPERYRLSDEKMQEIAKKKLIEILSLKTVETMLDSFTKEEQEEIMYYAGIYRHVMIDAADNKKNISWDCR